MPLELEQAERFRFYRLRRGGREKLLKRLRARVDKFKEVSLALVYGSFLGGYPFRDVDVAVYIAGKSIDPLKYKFKLDSALTEHLGYPVDVKVLNEAPAWFIREVLEEGRVLLARNPLLQEKLYLRALDEEETIRKFLKRL